ncbi:hypothetical protein MMC24_002675 [Lignoscripta atroalba]|nr:hypothetical protein [Lignoscripta atroalba]
MADFMPPPGPPPPVVPEGWKALWNDQYKEWFFVNTYTKQSTWERPTAPVYPDGGAPHGLPPSYSGSGMPGNEKTGVDADARYAAQLQAEEESRARAAGRPIGGGAGGDYYNNPQMGGQHGYDQQQLPPRPEHGASKGLGGLMGKLMAKASGPSQSHGYGQGGYPAQPGYGSHGYGQSGHGPSMLGGGGFMGQQSGHGYGSSHGGYGGYGGGYGGGGYGSHMPHKSGGGGMGMAGGAALGLGGGLVGGMMLNEAMDDDHNGGGYGGGSGSGSGSDNGGGSDGGGDYGGDDGGDGGGE